MRFKLPAHLKLTSIAETTDEVPEKYKDYYVLYNDYKSKEFLINPSIKFFLDYFVNLGFEAFGGFFQSKGE